MKKLVVSFLCLGLVLSNALVYAASIGGAETQGQGKFGVALDTEYVFERDLKDNGSDVDPGEEFKSIDLEELYRIMVKTSYGLLDNLDVYVKLGVADIEVSRVIYQNGAYDSTSDAFGRGNFAYGFGLKGNYELTEEWILGCDLQYVRHKNEFSWKTTNASGNVDSGVGDKKATIQEWHVAPYVAYRLDNFTPYLGLKYSDIRFEGTVGGYTSKYKADDNVGVFVGTDYEIGENLTLNLEGRFVDETALSFAATYKF
jgi:opacity protein-like surface antigen